MPFDDPRYTQPNMRGALGNLLQNFVVQSQNREKLRMAERELGFKDPNRKIGLNDLLSLAGDIYKTQSAYSGFPGYTPQQFDPTQFESILKGLQGLLSGVGTPTPQTPAPASSSPATQPVQRPSILQNYLQTGTQQPSAPSSPTPVTRQGTSYRSLWTRT